MTRYLMLIPPAASHFAFGGVARPSAMRDRRERNGREGENEEAISREEDRKEVEKGREKDTAIINYLIILKVRFASRVHLFSSLHYDVIKAHF